MECPNSSLEDKKDGKRHKFRGCNQLGREAATCTGTATDVAVDDLSCAEKFAAVAEDLTEWTKTPNTYCGSPGGAGLVGAPGPTTYHHGRWRLQTYSTFAEAGAACFANPDCTGVYDEGCQGSFALCINSVRNASTRAGSCVYTPPPSDCAEGQAASRCGCPTGCDYTGIPSDSPTPALDWNEEGCEPCDEGQIRPICLPPTCTEPLGITVRPDGTSPGRCIDCTDGKVPNESKTECVSCNDGWGQDPNNKDECIMGCAANEILTPVEDGYQAYLKAHLIDLLTAGETDSSTETTETTQETTVTPPATIETEEMIMRSDYNDALVQAVTYTGEPTTLTWELQHSLCAAAGRATPGSSHPNNDKYCAYSAADNHVVARYCSWSSQEFTHVSGTLGGGVGYMCAGSGYRTDCRVQVRVEGTTAADHTSRVTLNSGDAVFCSTATAQAGENADATDDELIATTDYSDKTIEDLKAELNWSTEDVEENKEAWKTNARFHPQRPPSSDRGDGEFKKYKTTHGCGKHWDDRIPLDDGSYNHPINTLDTATAESDCENKCRSNPNCGAFNYIEFMNYINGDIERNCHLWKHDKVPEDNEDMDVLENNIIYTNPKYNDSTNSLIAKVIGESYCKVMTYEVDTCEICPGDTVPSLDDTEECVCPPDEITELDGYSCSCPPGKYGESGNCMNCQVGYSQNLAGQSSCIPCDSGKYQDAVGQSGCTECQVGKYQGAQGESSCIECQVGKYQDAEGEAECIRCDSGKYQGAQGESSCIECQVGKYQAGEGATNCQSCPLGQYQDDIGQNSCKTCQLCSAGLYNSPNGERCGGPCSEGCTADLSSSGCANPREWGSRWINRCRGNSDCVSKDCDIGDTPEDMPQNATGNWGTCDW